MKRREPSVVFVVIYSHKHGTDVWVSKTHHAAIASVIETIVEYLGEIESKKARATIRDLIFANKYDEALKAWASYQDTLQEPESFEITTKVVLGPIARTRVLSKLRTNYSEAEERVGMRGHLKLVKLS